jgi:hypothetical protein
MGLKLLSNYTGLAMLITCALTLCVNDVILIYNNDNNDNNNNNMA